MQRTTITLSVGNSRSSLSPESIGKGRVKTVPGYCCVPPVLVGAQPPNAPPHLPRFVVLRGMKLRPELDAYFNNLYRVAIFDMRPLRHLSICTDCRTSVHIDLSSASHPNQDVEPPSGGGGRGIVRRASLGDILGGRCYILGANGVRRRKQKWRARRRRFSQRGWQEE